MNKICNVVYPGGAGGEFLTWALSQSPDFKSLSVDVESTDKWTVNPEEMPNHIHKEYEDNPKYNRKFMDYDFSDTLINLARDHMKTGTPELFNEYVETRYDAWNTAVFIILYPRDEDSIRYVVRHAQNKIVKYIRPDLSMQSFHRGLNRKIEMMGDRNKIILDPLDLYSYSIDKTVDKLISELVNVFGPLNISKNTIKTLISARKP